MKIKEKKIFVLDALGAFLSSFFLGIIQPMYHNLFGIPLHILHLLSAIPLAYFIFDLLVIAYIHHSKYHHYLKIIALLNTLYCLLSIIFAIYHARQIKLLGWLYIAIELLLILIIVNIEIKASNLLKEKKHS